MEISKSRIPNFRNLLIADLGAWIKSNRRKSFLAALAIAFIAHSAWWHLQPKHPDDLLFRKESFRLHNYNLASDEYRDVLRQLLPVGLPRSEVETLLVGKAGLKISHEDMEKNYVIYEAFGFEKLRLNGIGLCWVLKYFCERKWIGVSYDSADKIIQVSDKLYKMH